MSRTRPEYLDAHAPDRLIFRDEPDEEEEEDKKDEDDGEEGDEDDDKNSGYSV